MKTTSALIYITSVTEKNGIYTVSFWDENCNNENNATIQITKESILDFISDTAMNILNSDIDLIYTPEDYFSENKQLVIKEYIQFNS